jgi:hypothetical protein
VLQGLEAEQHDFGISSPCNHFETFNCTPSCGDKNTQKRQQQQESRKRDWDKGKDLETVDGNQQKLRTHNLEDPDLRRAEEQVGAVVDCGDCCQFAQGLLQIKITDFELQIQNHTIEDSITNLNDCR